MKRIAAPMVGGMVSSTILTLVVIPAVYALVKERELSRGKEEVAESTKPVPSPPVSVLNLLAGVVLFGAYVGILVGFIAAVYNRFTTPREA
jgi:hypothetical protein